MRHVYSHPQNRMIRIAARTGRRFHRAVEQRVDRRQVRARIHRPADLARDQGFRGRDAAAAGGAVDQCALAEALVRIHSSGRGGRADQRHHAYLLLRQGQASRVATLFYLNPPLTAAMGFVAFHETLAPMTLLGFALAAAGVYFGSGGAGGGPAAVAPGRTERQKVQSRACS